MYFKKIADFIYSYECMGGVPQAVKINCHHWYRSKKYSVFLFDHVSMKKKVITLIIGYAFLTMAPIVAITQTTHFVPKVEKSFACGLPGGPIQPAPVFIPYLCEIRDPNTNTCIIDYYPGSLHRYPDWRVESEKTRMKQSEPFYRPRVEGIFYLRTRNADTPCIVK